MARYFLAWIATGLLSGCGTAQTPDNKIEPVGDAAISVIERGWHTDISLPAQEVSGPLAALKTEFPGARFLVFGFGERTYYMSKDKTFGEMLAAPFPGPGTILLTALSAPPAEAFGGSHVITLRLSQPGVNQVVAFIWQSLKKKNDGLPDRLAEGPYPGSVFYAAEPRYDLFDNCNSWTMQALQQGGLPVHLTGVFFSDQVMEQTRRVAKLQGEQL